MTKESEYKLQRRVAGYHDIRMDGMADLVARARGTSVFDIGCNNGVVLFEMFNNGATVCHGCDIDADSIFGARILFRDFRAVQSHFAVLDLTGGAEVVAGEFGAMQYDIVLCLATYHKLKRIMSAEKLHELFLHFGKRTKRYFGWRGTSDKPAENAEEMVALDLVLKQAGLRRIHTSYISEILGVAAIWAR